LTLDAVGAQCGRTGDVYLTEPSGRPDLRPHGPQRLELSFDPRESLPSLDQPPFGRLTANARPAVQVRGHAYRIDPLLLTWFPAARDEREWMLDVACGTTHHRTVCERTGYRYVGLDVGGEFATVLGDAQALPFRDESFGFVLSIATLEHVPQPVLMLSEIARVLKPGGRLVGTVAFLEPYHGGTVDPASASGGSYCHLSPLGTLASLRAAGLDAVLIAPVPRWSVLEAQASMSLFPRLPRRAARSLVAPLVLAHRGWWALGSRVRKTFASSAVYRELSTAGAVCFVAEKPGQPAPAR
jgi:SAM-dependent methyltransferase